MLPLRCKLILAAERNDFVSGSEYELYHVLCMRKWLCLESDAEVYTELERAASL